MTFRHVAVTALVLALTATACGSDDEKKESSGLEDKVTVTGDFGEKPTIKIDAPLKVSETTAWTTKEGDGDKVGAEATTILDADARRRPHRQDRDLHQRQGTAPAGDQARRPGVPLADQVAGRQDRRQPGRGRLDRRTTRTATRAHPQIGIKGGDPIVMVADILSTDPTSVLDGPTGDTSAPPATAPKIETEGDDLTGLDFSGLSKPKKYQAIVLREGTGPEVEIDRIAADYIGQVWGGQGAVQQQLRQGAGRSSPSGSAVSSRPGTRD